MDPKAEQYFSRLMSREAEDQPSDEVQPEQLVLELPPWYDEQLFKRGQRFYHDHSFALSSSMLYGLVSVFAIPSILRILVSTRRSNSPLTAYRRYLSTVLHTVSWFDYDLKPGTTAWRSILEVRSRHIRASLGSKTKGIGIISQRDVAFTMFGFIGYAILKPDAFGVRQRSEYEWEAYNHFWRVFAHMIGLKEEFSLARETIHETRQACQILLDRIFTPCLENVPEYFEHSARVMLDGLWSFNPTIDVEGHLWWTRYLGGQPGYVYTETERIALQRRIRQELAGKSLDTGVDSTKLIHKAVLPGLPDIPPRKLYYNDYNTIEDSPAYKRLSAKSKSKLYFNYLSMCVYTSAIGRWYFNINFKFSVFLMKYFPYLSFFRFGFKLSFVNMFVEDIKDETKLVPNSDYTNTVIPETTWYEKLFIFFW